MISSENVAQNINFTISNILATKKQQKQQKQHFGKNSLFWAQNGFLTFLHIFFNIFIISLSYCWHFFSKRVMIHINTFTTKFCQKSAESVISASTKMKKKIFLAQKSKKIDFPKNAPITSWMS